MPITDKQIKFIAERHVNGTVSNSSSVRALAIEGAIREALLLDRVEEQPVRVFAVDPEMLKHFTSQPC